jgi:hypothetical protein
VEESLASAEARRLVIGLLGLWQLLSSALLSLSIFLEVRYIGCARSGGILLSWMSVLSVEFSVLVHICDGSVLSIGFCVD